MREPIIEFKNFGFKYKAQAEPTLFDINLSIYKGEKILICGPSGCGKSTLSHTLNGLIPSSYKGDSTGSLIIKGKPFTSHSIFSLSKIIGTVLQDSDGQFIGLSVGEDIAFALENENKSQEEMKKHVLEAAKKVGMEAFLTHAPNQLSGGQKQRVALAGVMVDNVEVFLFDEPLANLDPESGKRTIELIDELHKATGSTIIIIEHRIEDVLYRSVDRIVLMNEGRILSSSSPDALLSSNLLKENGIREPLYITALKYAGVSITEEKKPGRIDTLVLNDEDKEKVRSWYKKQTREREKKRQEKLLTISNISYTYPNGHEALKDISFTLYKGEMMSIVGKNGAGKSTLSKLICGFIKENSGSLFFKDEDFDSYSIKERAEHIGYVMQNPNQMITKPLIKEEVALGLKMRGEKNEEEIENIVNNTLSICGLRPFRSWPVSALSYGQKKRVTIASILSMNPEIIILDEPTAGQDFHHYTEIMEFLKKLNERGITIILITHDMHLMLEYSERACVFADGELVADKSPEEILTDDELTRKASLKKTSLSLLAEMCSLEEMEFVKRFIEYDKEIRG